MSYLGNSPPSQNFVAGADQFSGTGSQTVFTLSRNVNTVFDIFVTVSNVPQDPFTAYTISGNTLTFDSAPPSGTNNIDVVYRATNVQTFVPSPGVSQQFAIGTAASPAITFIGDTNTGIFSPAADTIAFTEGGTEVARFDSAGNFGIGTSSPSYKLQVQLPSSGIGAAFRYTGGTNNPGLFFSTNESTTVSTIDASASTSGILALNTSGTERMRIDSSGNVGVGTSSPNSAGVSRAVTINGSSDSILELNVNATRGAYFFSNAFNTVLSSVYTGVNLSFNTNDTTQARITSTGLFQFNSGYGSVATAYGCRAWVNFNGTGTVAIRASGNVSSITDNNTGDYTVNFTTAMPDANYVVNTTTQNNRGSGVAHGATLPTVSSVRVMTFITNTLANSDDAYVFVSITR